MTDDIVVLLRSMDSKLDKLLGKLSGDDDLKDTALERELYHAVASLTPRQHATMQMLMAGHTNQKISDVFGVSINTVKVHVRTVCKKFNVKSRGQLSAKAVTGLDLVSDDEYENISGGLPKDWAINHLGEPEYEGIIK